MKRSKFSARDEELARIAKALSAPAKIVILRTLAERRECICGEIVEITPLSQSTVSQHLKELKELGLIQGRIEGVKSCYCVNQEGFLEFAELLSAFVRDIKKGNSGKTKPLCKKE
jgi:ArsR family transcriptional regulator